MNESKSSVEQVTLKPGDYVNIDSCFSDGVKAIGDAFVNAGAIDSDNGRSVGNDRYLGWDSCDGEICGFFLEHSDFPRLLTIDEVLNATNAKPEVKEWRGPEDGLPPVGTMCEFYDKNHSVRSRDEINFIDHCIIDTWRNLDKVKVVCHVVMHGNECPVVQHDLTQTVTTIAHRLLRPIRTEEEKAVKEMLACINQYYDTATAQTASPRDYVENAIQQLYRAGYRKTNSTD